MHNQHPQPHPIIKLPVAELKVALSGLGKVVPRSSTLSALSTVHVERDPQGWIHVTATDLDTFLSLRLEAPWQVGEPARCLVPFVELQKLARTCPADEVLELETLGAEQLLLRVRIGSHPVEHVIATEPVADFPTAPTITTVPVNLDDAARATLLDALACASHDETRAILGGVYLDVSKPSGHYAVATDGRHLFAANSLHLDLPSSVLVPDHRFLSWGGFVKDGPWKLSVQPATKDKGGFLRLESRRWTFTTKQVEGTYPNWRMITGDVGELSGCLVVNQEAAEAMARIVPRLPGDEAPNHTVGLHSASSRLYLRGVGKGQPQATEVEVPGVTVSGEPATVYLNRRYLLRAIGFGLRTIGIQEPLKPVQFRDEAGSRQMIVMPVRVDGYTDAPRAAVLASAAPTSPVNPAAASTNAAAPDQPATLKDNHNHHSQTQNPPTAERNHPPMQNNATNQNNPNLSNSNNNQPAAEDKNSLEAALDQIEAVKASLRGAVTNLNLLADTLRQVQRERRISEREVRSVRDTLKSLQTVRL